MHNCVGDVSRYQTKRIERYGAELRRQAEGLFGLVSGLVRARGADVDHCCRRFPGSFSIVVPEQGETSAKIVMYERPHGKRGQSRTAWDVEDGVYIWVRAEGTYEKLIQEAGFAGFQSRYPRDADRRREVCVAPNDPQHFYYFRITADEKLARLADFLAFCSTLRRDTQY